MLVGVDLVLFPSGQLADLAVIAFLAMASTVFVHFNLVRRAWFLTFVAVATAAHLGLVIAFPDADFGVSDFKLLASADVLGVVSLVFGLEKLLSLRKLTAA